MKIKTSDLTGPALDWAVATCEGVDSEAARLFHEDGHYNYSTDWAHGGPIIERERMTLTYNENDDAWEAYYETGMNDDYERGPTPLIAAMRCFVASKLGDEVDVPEELI